MIVNKRSVRCRVARAQLHQIRTVYYSELMSVKAVEISGLFQPTNIVTVAQHKRVWRILAPNFDHLSAASNRKNVGSNLNAAMISEIYELGQGQSINIVRPVPAYR